MTQRCDTCGTRVGADEAVEIIKSIIWAEVCCERCAFDKYAIEPEGQTTAA